MSSLIILPAQWAAKWNLYFTRSRPYKKNDQAHVESKNGHVCRRYAFYYRYDTPSEVEALNRLWETVMQRLNFFTPTKKTVSWEENTVGRRRRIYDKPRTPYQRLLDSDVLTTSQIEELEAYRKSLNPAEIARDIQRCQDLLVASAKDKTNALTQAEETRHQRRQAETTRDIQHAAKTLKNT